VPTPSPTWEDNDLEYINDFTEARADVPASVPYVMTVIAEHAEHRLDYAISRELGISRNHAQFIIKNGLVTPEREVRIKPSVKVAQGDIYTINVPPPETLELEPEDVPFGVVHSDDDIIVVDKPAGLVVHPAPGHYHGTLVHGLLYRFPKFGEIKGVIRPGIVHRLDATTSGLMVVARNGFAMEKLYAQFKSRAVEKTYIFLCHGTPCNRRARIDAPIGRAPDGKKMTLREDGRNAVTDYEILWSDSGFSLGKCVIHTGRTHQIRVHMKSVGCPLVGDVMYAPSRETPFEDSRVFLHSWKLSFTHPRTGEKICFRSFIPQDLKSCLVALRTRARGTDPRLRF